MAKKRRLIRVGIAGLGRTGWNNHARVLEPLKDRYRLSAVLDANPDRMKEANERFGCTPCHTYGELVNRKDVDLVVVGLPNHLHADYTIEALKAGKHVVCEKPMATSLADADRMIRAAKRAKGCLTIFQNRRFTPDFMKVREIIRSGKLGRITLIRLCVHGFSRRWDWQTLRKFGGGSLNNTGPHFLDQALQLLGDRYPSELFCQLDRATTLGDADDHVKVVMKAKGSPVVEVEVMSDVAYPRPLWLVTGTRGGLAGTPGELRWKWIIERRLVKREVDEAPTPDRSYNSEDLPWSKERVWEPGKATPKSQTVFYTTLHEALMKRAAPPITPESVRRQMKLIEECHRRCGL